jgi:hypothetical protein
VNASALHDRPLYWRHWVDFAVAGLLLAGAGLVYVVAARAITGRRARLWLGLGLAALLLVLWAELAVGIFGSPLAGS